ncbi:MAG: macro domain-containing protein [Gemmatimonadota bacterium]|nr:macro domain-containing protein [Gemmatimonadota bacterium]
MIESVQADITTLAVDAIVNAANSELAGGGGVDGAIHRSAGPELLSAGRALAPVRSGSAVLTAGFRLSARYVVHAVGPIWKDGHSGEPEELERAYEASFRVAWATGVVRTIAFPAISTGLYGYPKQEAAAIAVRVMRRHEPAFERIIACTFDPGTLGIYARLLAS